MKRRVYQVAKEFRISSEALIGVLVKLGYDVKTHMNAIDDDVVEKARAEFEKEKDAVKREYVKKVKAARAKAKAPEAGKGTKAEAEGATKAKAAAPAKKARAAAPATAKTPAAPARASTAAKTETHGGDHGEDDCGARRGADGRRERPQNVRARRRSGV